MGDISSDTLRILVFLIPGFLSSTLLNTLIVRRPKETLDKVVEALIFSFVIYAVVAIAIRETPVVFVPEEVGETTTLSIHYNPKVVVLILALAVLFPLLLGLLTTTNAHMKLLRAVRITEKSARETVWLDVFADQKRYVIVNLKSGRRVFGWPMYYSNTPEEGMIYLYNPAWIGDNGQYIDLDIHGLFLVGEDINSIEFSAVSAENARERKESESGAEAESTAGENTDLSRGQE